MNLGLFVVELGVDSLGTSFEFFWASEFLVWGEGEGGSFLFFAFRIFLGGGGGGGVLVGDFPGGFQGVFSEAFVKDFLLFDWGSLGVVLGPRLELRPNPKPFFIKLE